MSALDKVKLSLNNQVLEVTKKATNVEISGKFSSPSYNDMKIFFAFGCKCLGVTQDEFLSNRTLIYPTLNWSYKTFTISNLDRFIMNKNKPYFKLTIPICLLSNLITMFNEIKLSIVSMPSHSSIYLVYADKTYEKDTDIKTSIAIKKPVRYSFTKPKF